MKAAVVPELGAPLEIRDIPVPQPGPGQVLVRMLACGVCHTAIHAASPAGRRGAGGSGPGV